MTFEEAVKQWQGHSPWIRASKELIAAIQQRTKQEKREDEFQKMIDEAGEAP